jgi:hypothetical protein
VRSRGTGRGAGRSSGADRHRRRTARQRDRYSGTAGGNQHRPDRSPSWRTAGAAAARGDVGRGRVAAAARRQQRPRRSAFGARLADRARGPLGPPERNPAAPRGGGARRPFAARRRDRGHGRANGCRNQRRARARPDRTGRPVRDRRAQSRVGCARRARAGARIDTARAGAQPAVPARHCRYQLQRPHPGGGRPVSRHRAAQLQRARSRSPIDRPQSHRDPPRAAGHALRRGNAGRGHPAAAQHARQPELAGGAVWLGRRDLAWRTIVRCKRDAQRAGDRGQAWLARGGLCRARRRLYRRPAAAEERHQPGAHHRRTDHRQAGAGRRLDDRSGRCRAGH